MPPVDPGQCADCIHARITRSDRGTPFYQCLRSFDDPRFPKYPRLPVRNCAGHEAQPSTG